MGWEREPAKAAGPQSGVQSLAPRPGCVCLSPISQGTAPKPGKTGVEEGSEQSPPACCSPPWDGRDLRTLLPHKSFPLSYYGQRRKPLPWLVASILGLVILWEGHKKKIPRSQTLCVPGSLWASGFSQLSPTACFPSDYGFCFLLLPSYWLAPCDPAPRQLPTLSAGL